MSNQPAKTVNKSELAETNQFKKILNTILQMRELNLMIIILLFATYLVFFAPHFATWNNIKVVLGSFSTDGIMVIGMTIVLISGSIDLSIGSAMCFAMTICAKMILAGYNPWLALVLTIILTSIMGLIMGLLITQLKLTPFITTLCFMGIARGLVLVLSGGTPISVLAKLMDLPFFRGLGQGQIGGIIPTQVVIFLVLAVLADFIVRKSAIMRVVFYTGSNEKAAEYSGIQVARVRVFVHMVCTALAAFAGVIYLTKFNGVPMSAGVGAEMTAISSAVIGGCSMNGGKGTILGAILGLTLMALVTNAMNLFIVPAFWQELIRYCILLSAVILDHLQQNAMKKAAS